jgi:uncharacterized protein with LGFP repeats
MVGKLTMAEVVTPLALGGLARYDVDSGAPAQIPPFVTPTECTDHGGLWVKNRFSTCTTGRYEATEYTCTQICTVVGSASFRIRILAWGASGNVRARSMQFLHYLDQFNTFGTGGSFVITIDMGCRPQVTGIGECHIASGRRTASINTLAASTGPQATFQAVSDPAVDPPPGDPDVAVWALANSDYRLTGGTNSGPSDFPYAFRFDSQGVSSRDFRFPGGAVFPQGVPRFMFNRTDASITQSATHVYDALNRPDTTNPAWPGGGKSIPGGGRNDLDYLSRTKNVAEDNANRMIACPANHLGIPDFSGEANDANKSCDEFPFASTHEGAQLTADTGLPQYSRRLIRLRDNSTAGARVGTFYAAQRILHDDSFAVGVYGAPPPDTPVVVNVTGGGQFASAFQAVGGDAVLGQPLGNWFSIDGGQEQDFSSGAIFWSAGTATHATYGAIYSYYRTLGGPGGSMGFPTSDTTVTPDGIGRWNSFQDGRYIHWSPATGPHATWGSVREKWAALDWEKGILGYPVTDVQPFGGGQAGYFAGSKCGNGGLNGSGSAIYSTAATGTHEIHGCIYDRYNSVGGPSRLGLPVSDEGYVFYDDLGQPYGSERVSYLQGAPCGTNYHPFGGNAGIYFSGFGTSFVNGCIFDKYQGLQGPSGMLGLPVQNEIDLGAGRWVSYFSGQKCGNGGPSGSGSAIYHLSSTGTHEIHGCIFDRYVAVGGHDRLGVPVTDELPVFSNQPGGPKVSYLQGAYCGPAGHPYGSGGAIYNSGFGTWFVNGCIYDRYLQLAGPAGALEFPIGNEIQLAPNRWVSYFSGQKCNGGAKNGSGSAIYSTEAGTYDMRGCIYEHYDAVGGPGRLGFPVSPEGYVFYNGLGEPYGSERVSYVQGAPCGTAYHPYGGGGAIYYSGSGTWFVNGCIFDKYQRLGGPPGMLGFPVFDEVDLGGGRWVSYFAGQKCGDDLPNGSGSAIYHSEAGTHEVHGCIYAKYQHIGGHTGSGLGFPTSDEYRDANNNPRSDFQYGYIVWANGQANVYRTGGGGGGGTMPPTVTTLERNTSACPGNDQFYSATDGNGAPINWTYATISHPCIRVSYTPVQTSLTCDYSFYVPNAHATGQIEFKFWWTASDGVPKSFTIWLNENPVSGFQHLVNASNVYRIEFTDANGQGSPYQIGWGADTGHGMRQIC